MRRSYPYALACALALVGLCSGCVVTFQDLYDIRDSLEGQVAAVEQQVQQVRNDLDEKQKEDTELRKAFEERIIKEDVKKQVLTAKQLEDLRTDLGAAYKEMEEVSREVEAVKADMSTVRDRQAELSAELYGLQTQGQQRSGEIEREVLSLKQNFAGGRGTDTEQFERVRSSLEERIARLDKRLEQLETTILALESAAKAKPEPKVTPPPPRVETPPAVSVPAKPETPAPPPKQAKVAPPRPPETPAPPPVQKPAEPEIRDPQTLYNTARSFFQKERYSEARTLFVKFTGLYPNDPRADNAQFWIGDTYFREGKFEDAILEYQKVIQRYGTGNKVPDALLKQGMAFQKLGDTTSARILFQKLIREFGESEQAKTAMSELRKLK